MPASSCIALLGIIPLSRLGTSISVWALCRKSCMTWLVRLLLVRDILLLTPAIAALNFATSMAVVGEVGSGLKGKLSQKSGSGE